MRILGGVISRTMIVLAGALLASAQTQFTGTIQAELVLPDKAHQISIFKLPTDEQRKALRDTLQPGDLVFAGTVRGAMAFVVERSAGEPALYVDLDGDKQITAAERHSLEPSEERLITGNATVRLPLAGGPYRHYPVRVYVYRKQKDESSRMVGESPRAIVRAQVDLGGNPLLVEYTFDRKTRSVALDTGWQGMDLNGDGVIETSVQSGEFRYARNENLIFRVGDRYLSTTSIDLEKRKVVLRAHSARDYTTIEFRVGVQVPDFSFTDLNGKSRRLSDFRGRYVLLDFWATWCGPCVAELPRIKAAYERFGGRRFEVLGMNFDEEPEKVFKMVAEQELKWPQAMRKSIEKVVETHFRIAAWPTYLLMDGDRRIVVANNAALSGERLAGTLEKFLH